MIKEFDPMLSQVLDLQEKIQRQKDHKEYTVTYDANLYEFITKEQQELVKRKTSYQIFNQPIEDRFDGDWNAFMNFARKNRGWANKIETVDAG